MVDASRARNPFIEDQKVKLEDLSVAEMTMREGDWQVKTDMDKVEARRSYKKESVLWKALNRFTSTA